MKSENCQVKRMYRSLKQQGLILTALAMSVFAGEYAYAQTPSNPSAFSDQVIETVDQTRIFKLANKKRRLLKEAEDELSRRRSRLGRLEQDVLRRYKALRMLQEELSSSIKRSRREDDESQEDSSSSDERRAVRALEVRKLAKSFESMKPAAAAKVIEVMDDELVVDVLRVVSPRKSGKIMGSLDPKTAARVSELMTSMRRR